MIHVECKITGEIIRTDVYRWRMAINHVKEMSTDVKITTKSSTIIQQLRNGYEDKFIKAYIIPGDWRTDG